MSKVQKNKLQEEADAYLRQHHIVELFEVTTALSQLTQSGPVHLPELPPTRQCELVPRRAASAQEGQGIEDRTLRLRGDHQYLQAV